MTSAKRNTKKHIKDYVKIQKVLFKLSETNIKVEEIKEENDQTDEIWEKLNSNFDRMMPFVEETIDRWNNRTKIFANIKNNKRGPIN